VTALLKNTDLAKREKYCCGVQANLLATNKKPGTVKTVPALFLAGY
jgi:hypothetical protein